MQHTSLSTSHEVTTTHDNGNGVLLDRSRALVSSKGNVGDEVLVKRRTSELGDGLGDIMTGRLDGDVVVLVKVDTGSLDGTSVRVGRAEKLTLELLVDGSGNVLAIDPAALAGTAAAGAVIAAAATTTTTTELAGNTVGVGVEATTSRLRRRGVPVGGTGLRSTGSEGRGAAPSIDGTSCRAAKRLADEPKVKQIETFGAKV